MGWPDRLLCVVALLGCSTVGCSDGGTLGTAPLVATVSSWDQVAEVRVPLGGAQLCETNTTNCTVTYASGLGVIQVPVGQEISYTLEKEGYASYVYADVVPSDGSQPTFVMLTDELLAKQHARLMSPYPLEDKGEIAQRDAEIRIEEAKGIAQAQKIINATLTPNYLQHEAIQAQRTMANAPNHTTVYIPVGTNGLPLVHTR